MTTSSRRPTGHRDARSAPRVAGTLAGVGSPIQAALRIGKPGDRYEREADAVAQHVVTGGTPGFSISSLAPGALGPQGPATQQEDASEEVQQRALQRQEAEEEQPAQETPLQRQEGKAEEEQPAQETPLQRQEEEEEPRVQTSSSGAAPSPTREATSAVRSPGPGNPLNAGTRATLEERMGADLSRVRVHEGGRAADAAQSIRARAFTYGNHIWLGGGESQSNLRLMAHEATHVVQQGAAVQRRPRAPAISRAPAQVQGGWRDALGSIGSAIVSGAKAVGGAVVSGVKALGAAAKRKLLGLLKPFAHSIPGYHLLTVILGRDPVTDELVERNATNLVRGFLSLIPGGDAVFQRIQESGALQKTFSWLSDQVKKLDLGWEKIKGLFKKAWESLSAADIASPSRAWSRLKGIFGPPVARIFRFAKAVGTKVKEFIFEAAMRLAGPMAAKVMGFIKKAKGALGSVFGDPIGFLKNLLQAVVKGFTQFKDKIWGHLKKGLLGWIFGALEGAGIQIPEKFDLRGIVSLVLQVLGLTYERIRAKLVDRFGEEKVARIEQAVEFVKILVTEGLAGAWRKIVEFFGNLKETVMGAIRNWVITKIVTAAVTKLASMFNPVGAIIQAIITIYNVVAFFVERFKQIIALANAVFESIANIAAGKIGAAANYVEETMSRTLPVIISFLARLIGLGGISGKIKAIIKEIQKRVDKVIKKVLDFIIEKAKALLGGAKRAVGAVKEKLTQWWNAKKSFKTGGESHAISFKGEGASARLIVASDPIRFEDYLGTLKKKGASDAQLKTIRDKYGEIKAAKQGDKPGKKAKINKTLGEKIEKLLGELAALLEGVATSESRPPSKVKFETTTKAGATVGDKMTAKPLSMIKGDTTGSEPSESNPLWEAVRVRNLTKITYIRGHLLNHHLHGPGMNKNLTPITGSLNRLMSSRVEENAKDAVLKNNAVVSYVVDVDYGGHGPRKHIPEESVLATSITMTLKQMRLKKNGDGKKPGDWEEGRPEGKDAPKVDEKTVPLDHGLPPDTAVDAVQKIANLSADSAAEIQDATGVSAAVATALVTRRGELKAEGKKGFHTWDDVETTPGVGSATIKKLKEQGQRVRA